MYLTETWLLKSEEHSLHEFEADFIIITVPATKLTTGRPFGGTILLLNRHKFFQTDVITQEMNTTTVTTHLFDTSLTLSGVYMPTSNTTDYIEVYKTQLSTLTGIHTQFATTSESIILGDFQCFPKVSNTTRIAKYNTLSKFLTNFINEMNLQAFMNYLRLL